MSPTGVGSPPAFRFNSIFNQPFFAITAFLHILAWIVTFIAQCLAEAKYHASKSPTGQKQVGTPIGVGWFGIFYQFFLCFWILTCVGRDVEHQYCSQLAALVAVNVVIGVLSSNLGIYSMQELSLMIVGFGWLVLSMINLSWLIYFTSPEDSRLLSILNPSYQRKQLIRSSIILRRPGPYDEPPNVQNIVLGYSPANQIRSEDAGSARLAPGGDIYGQLNENKSSIGRDRSLSDDFDLGHHSYQPYLPGYRVPRPSVNIASFAPAVQPQHDPAPTLHQGQHHHTRSHHQSQHQPPSQPLRQQHNPPHHPISSSPTQGLTHDNTGHTPLRVVNSIDIPTSLGNGPSALSSQQQQQPLPISPIPPPTSAFTPLATERIGSALFSQEASLNDPSISSPTSKTTTSRNSHQSLGQSHLVAPFHAQALFNYKASPADPRELSIEKGEIVEIYDSNGKWWRAKKQDGSSGILPSNYVTPISLA